MNIVPSPRDFCHLTKGIERIWVKPVSKIRTAETRKRREKS